MSPTNHETSAAAEEYISTLPPHHVQPLWTVMNAMVPPMPNPKAIPYLWNYKELRPLLLQAGDIVGAEEAERRVLMLVNPACKAPQTTDTLYAGLQLILPNETAPAHRHTAFALRFIIEGSRGFTAVEGKKIYMSRGDVILTPSWTWHDHGHEGSGPMIWLDGLDLPMYQFIPGNFAQIYHDSRYPSEPVDESPSKFPWAPVQEALDNQGGDYAQVEYLHEDGQRLSRIIGGHAERVKAGTTAPQRKETSSFVFHVYQGRGYTLVGEGSEQKKLQWEQSDTFAVPHWKRIQHVVEEGEDAYLFSFSDRPLMMNLGMWKKEEF
ncbi:RmlC-like cupin domain-containing protein [Pyronema omphalodes]|nr:RmlC-like cupin domain-containing protein [Pyronema omphalodes]